MIEQVTMYKVVCDECSQTLDYDGDYMIYESEYEAEQNAKESEWEEIDGKWYCADCIDRLFVYDWDNDSFVRKG